MPKTTVTVTSSPSMPLTGTFTRDGPRRNAGHSSPSHSMRRPAAGLVPSPQAAAVTLVAYIDPSIVCNVRRLSCVPT